MEIFKWTTSLIEFFASIWEWVSTPLFTIGEYEISFLGVFSTTILGLIVIAKIVALAIPN